MRRACSRLPRRGDRGAPTRRCISGCPARARNITLRCHHIPVSLRTVSGNGQHLLQRDPTFAACAHHFLSQTGGIIVRTSIVRAVLTVTLTLIGSAYADDHHATTYSVTNLASLGGTNGGANAIDNRGWVSGFSNLPGDLATHATLWRDGTLTDLGTLGGPNSEVGWPVKNNRGIISGFAETTALDPFGENWSCSAFFPTVTHHTCLGFVWGNGVMRALATLGGNNGFATGSNNSGHVVGWAENTVHDSTCVAPQVLQFRAVDWAPYGSPPELPPLPGDTTSAATAIN